MFKSRKSLYTILAIIIAFGAVTLNRNKGEATEQKSVPTLEKEAVTQWFWPTEEEVSPEIDPSVKGARSVSDTSENVSTIEKGIVKESIEDPLVYNFDEGTSIQAVEDDHYITEDYSFESSDRGVSNLSIDLRVPSTNNNEREVMGFLPYWKLSSSSVVNWIQYDKLSTIAYFGLTCYDNGTWVNDSGYSGFNSANFDNMLQKANAAGVKVVLVVKNFHFPSIVSIVSNTGGAGDRLIDNIVAALKSKGLDGVNMDFEYSSDYSGSVTNTIRAKFVAWHDKLADRLHAEIPGAVVSTDVYASSGTGYSLFDLAGLGATSLDYVMMMSYDYITTSCYDGKIITPMSPLYGNGGWNVSTHISGAMAQMPAGKLIMGIPYYGIDFKVKSVDFANYNARADYPTCSGVIETYGSIVDPVYDLWHNATTIKWNNTEKSRWYAYDYYGDLRHGYYDDPSSLSVKYDYVRSNNLGGIGIWVIGYDHPSDDLWTVIRDKFQRVPFLVKFKNSISASQVNSILSSNRLVVTEQMDNNVWRVSPISDLSSTAITTLRSYSEVLTVGFDGSDSNRNISLPN